MNDKIKTLNPTSCLVAASLMLSSCDMLGPKQTAKIPLHPVEAVKEGEQSGVMFKELQNKAPSETERQKSELYPSTGPVINKPTERVSVKTKTGEKGSYTLNFDEADLGEVAKVILGDILKVNYILSPKVAGKVTLQTNAALTKEELLPTLEKVLKMNNAALVKQGDIYRIEPSADAVFNAGLSPDKLNSQAGFLTKVIPVRYVSVTELADVIKPLVDEKTIVNGDPANNTLIVSGSAEEIARVLDLVYTFDIDILRGRSFGLFPLSHVAPEDIIKELEVVFNSEGGGKEENGGEFFRFLPIERMNAVLAITHQPRYLADIEHWVFRLDKANTESGGGVNVYRCQHANATDLADTLNAIFTGSQPQAKTAKVAAGETAATITNKGGPGGTSKKSASRGAGVQTGEAAVAGISEVRIIPDEINNAIVVISSPQEYEIIHKVMEKLDVMPLQVLIDATIVQVSLTDSLQYGIRWFFDHNAGGTGTLTGGGPTPSATTTGTTLPNGQTIGGISLAQVAANTLTGGFGYSFISNSGDIKILLTAEAKKNKVNVISSPSIMVLNNQEASIQVGDEVPLRTSQSTSVTNVNSTGVSGQTSGGLVTSGIQQRKTGVKLKVKPRVNANGFVIMDIEQTVEKPVPTTTSNIDSPTIQDREITSNVAVHSGETLVLGGLIDDTNTYNRDGIPWWYRLPWIGPLFGSTVKSDVKTELVVLLTPRVVHSKMDARFITDEFKRKLTGIYYEPSAKKHEKTAAEQLGL